MTNNYTVAFWEANQSTLDAGPNFNIDDSAANIQAALNALNGDDHISQIIIADNAAVSLNVAKLTSDATALSKLINQDNSAAQLTVRDTAAHIGGGFATIGASSQVTSVVISDNSVVTLTASQMTNNQAVLGELANANATAVNVTLKDTAVHIAAGTTLDVVEAHLSTITSIVVSNSFAMTLTASQIANDGGALALVTNNNGNDVSFKVADTGANIGTNLNALQANGQITVITDTDNSAINLSIAQFTSDATALSKIVNADSSSVSFHVSDTAANITSNLDALSANVHVTQIIVTNSAGHEVNVTVAQITSDSAALAELFNSDGTTHANVNVIDTSANISAALDALNSNTQVNSIAVNPLVALNLTASQVANDTTALGEITNGGYTIHVSDTAAHITANLNALQANSHVNQIVVSDNNEITVSVTQLTTDATAIGELSNQNASTVHVIVADTAGTIAAQIGALNGNTLVNKIVVTDSATNEVTITAAQAAADSTVLGELFLANGTTPAHVAVLDNAANISGAFDALNANSHVDKIIVNNSPSEVTISVAQAAADSTALGELFQSNGTTPAHVAVNDTAANISAAFDALNANTHVDKIIVNDGPVHAPITLNEVTISVTQAANDTVALGELYQTDGVTHAHVAVSDTAANISGAFNALNANTHVDKIIVSDSATHTVTITAAQAGSDSTALGELFQANGTTHATVFVSDTAANISSAFDALNTNTHVSEIIVSDSATHEVTITAAQAAADTTAIGELFQAGGIVPANVAVSDTASNISGAFDALSANSRVDKIIVSDSATHEVTISVTQAANDGTALGELFQSNGTTPAHVAVSDTASNISGAFNALNANTHVDKIVVSNSGAAEVTITVTQAGSDTAALGELFQSDGTTPAHVEVSDTAANISAAFDALNANTHVDKILISPTAALTLTATQVATDTTALGEIQGSYSINVGDTAANITSNLDALQTNGHVTKVVVSDSATHEVNVTVAQLTSDAGVLGELFNSDGTTPAHVAVSDTAAHIGGSEFDTLNGNTQVNKIIVSDSASHEVTISAAQAASDTTALGELFQANGTTPADVAVNDTAANVTSALNALNANTHVDNIIVSDSATNEVSVTVAQITSDATALGELYNSDGATHAHVTVADTALNVTNALDALNSNTQVNKVIVTNDIAPVTITEVQVTVTQLSADTTVLSELFYSDGTTPAKVAVFDTAAHISAALDTINGNTQVDHIIISDNGTITLTVAEALNDATAIGELENNDASPVTLVVSDTASAIAGGLDGLNAESNISSIVISDNNPLTLTAVQIGADTSALAKLVNGDTSGVQINVVDNAANISANLDALQANNDIVSITVSDSAPITVTVAQINSDAVVLSELVNADTSTVSLTVKDTATNIRTNLASLNQNSEITSIVISNNLALKLTVAQLTADAHALSIMHNANGSPYQINISDNASHISSALDTLAANTHVTLITVTDSAAITLSIAQITSDATALAELANANSTPYTLSVHDTAANISGNFDALNNNSHVVQIVVSDSATHEVLISAVQFSADGTALGELFQSDGTTQAHVDVSDTAANVTSAINGLVSTQVDKITVTDSASHEVVVSIAQITSDAAALAKLFDADGTTPANVTASDTAANITAALASLNANTQVNKVIVSDSATNEVAVSIAQITSDATLLGELYNSNGTTHANVTVNDTAANITAALDSLSSNSQVNKIVVSDSATNEVVATVNQLTSDATALAELFNANGTTAANVKVNDTAAAVSSHFDALNADTQVNKIIVSDSATNEVTLLAAQIVSDAAALAELFQANGTTPAHVKVSDTAANVSTNFDALNASGQVDKIVVTNSGSAEVTITAAQAHNDTTALGELFNSDGTTPAHVAVNDTAANISSALAQLNTNTHVDKIFISDSNPLTLSVSQVVHDTTALGEIQGSYTIDVNDTAAHISGNLDALEANASVTSVIVSDNKDVTVSIAQLSSDANLLSVMVDNDGTTPARLRISDTAANIQSNLGNLEIDTQNHNIDVISISDNGAITLSASQLTIDSDALMDLRNADSTKVQLTLSDTGAHIQAVLDAIESYNTNTANSTISSIVVTNNAQMTITAAQVVNDASVLAEVTNRNGSPVTFKVVDTAANITADLNALEANSQLSTIVISDNGAIGLSVAQITGDAAALALLHNQNGNPYSLTVTDTASHVQAALSSLNSNSHVDKIVVSDSATNEVGFTVSALNHDTNVLGELYNADGTTHASIELVDSAGHIQALTATQIQNLAAEGVNLIDSTNNKLLLSVAQYEALGTVALTQSDTVTLSDTGVDIAAMTVNQIAALAANGIDKVVATDHALTLSLAQWDALTVPTDFNTTVTINGTSGNDAITVGNNNYHLVGGAGADLLTVGMGHDMFVYNATSDSTGPTYDTIVGFDAMRDQIQLGTSVSGIDSAVHSGALDSGANFNAELAAAVGPDQLDPHFAVLFTATSGSLSGHTFLIVDTNGLAGYQAGADLVIDVTGGHHLSTLSTSDFLTFT
jgi:hypothetical protein